jgi:thiopeptide-type bacteriocin biosynthesis protein
MPGSPEERGWLGEHLFHAGGIYSGACDAVLLEAVEPFVRACESRGWIDRWFFIRYGERGPHVRLRLHGVRAVLERDVAPALRDHLAGLFPGVAEGFPEQPSPGPGSGVSHVATVPYEPETDRYGGPEGVLLAEEFFGLSSEAALDLLRGTRRDERSSRLGKALLAMVVLVHVFRGSREGAGEFARGYGTGYLRALVPDEERRGVLTRAFGGGFEQQADTLTAYVEEAWHRLDSGDALSDALDRYRAGLEEVRGRFGALLDAGRLSASGSVVTEWERAVAAIVSSYVHMMNNRLGVTIQEESYLAYLIHRSLGGAPAPAWA